ncbi:MAG: zf-HC2 domain-containing protein [Candidatus Methylomirabilia bacterium]
MNCSEARGLFSARADELLTPEQDVLLDRHLERCVECPREWERFRQTLAVLHSLEEVQAPGGFSRRVIEAAVQGPWHRRLFRRIFLPLYVKLPLEAAALVLVSTLVIVLFRQTPEIQRVVEAPPARELMEPAPPAQPKAAELKQRRAFDIVRKKERPEEDEGVAPAEAESRGGRLEIAGEARKSAAAPPEAQRAPRARAPLHVVGRLRAKDSEAVDRQINTLLKRVGGVVRRDVMGGDVESGRTIIVVVPREDYPGLAAGLSQIGDFTVEKEPRILPDPVHVTIQIAD